MIARASVTIFLSYLLINNVRKYVENDKLTKQNIDLQQLSKFRDED